MAEEISEREKAVNCIKAISRIQGYAMSQEGMTHVLHDSFDELMQYFEELLKELDR
jgi:hypothetical protein